MPTPYQNFTRYKLPAFGWFLLIMILISLPGHSLPSVSLWQFDKLVHFALFFVQLLLFWIALELPEPMYGPPAQSIITATVLVALFAAGSEVFQHLVTDRTADAYDVIANLAGTAAATVLLFSRGAEASRAWLVRQTRSAEDEKD